MSEQHQIENLNQIKDQLSQMIPPGFVGPIIHDKVEILDAHPALASMFGYESSELVGKTVLELATPEARSLILKKILLKYDEPYETVALKKDGTTFPIEIYSQAIAGHKKIRAMAIRAITNRQEMEVLAALHQVKSELELNLKENTTQLRFANERLRDELDERKRIETELKAIALENARLFEQTQVALDETATLYRLSRTLAQLDSESEMFELVLIEYLQYLDLQQGSVLLIDDSQKYGTLRARMVKSQLVEPGLRVPVAGNPIYTQLIATREPVVISDVLHNELSEPVRDLNRAPGLKSLLLVPIVVRGEVIGALGADATETVREFTERETSLMKAMADQLGIAIENIRLHAATQRHAERLASLHELDRALTSSLRLSDVYHVFARHAIRLLPYDHTSITLLHGDEMQVAYAAEADEGEPALPVELKLPRKTSAMGWVVERGQPLLRHNISVEARFAEDEHLAARGIRSMMIIPLRVKGQAIGAWNIGSRQVGAFSPDDLEIPQGMADQLAIAIENSGLYQEIQQYLEELTTLNLISQTITSTLDLREMLAIITDRTLQLLGVAATAVALYDENSGDLSFVAAQGQGADFVRGKRMALGQGVVGWVVQHGEPALIPDVSKDPRFFREFDRESGFTTRSILCVPLQTRGQTIGAIEVMNKEDIFDEDDLRLLSSLATPAAAAIMNAQLYERAQQEIAERKRAETALQEERVLLAQRVAERTVDLSAANAELARAARLKDQFLASMSHELRTPLTAILGLSEVLKATVYGPLTEKQLKSVRQIEESGRHLLALINDILDLSKIEAGKLELQVGPVSVETVCQASLQFVKEAALKKQLEIFWRYDEKATTLPADERRLKQILVNLLSNAVKFTSEGGQIGLEVVGDTAQQVIHFTVWDTGIGISPEDKARLFQPFVQLDSSLSRQYAGTGLGLALVQRMVEMHGGRVSLESEGVPGRGSRFTVSLPWPGWPEAAKSAEKIEPAAVNPPSPSPSPDQSAPLILVAEDESSIYTLLSDYLTDCGYRVVVARNGAEALEQAEAEPPHLILMDVQMPKLDGLEATRRLRAKAEFAAVPIIALTALAMPGDREKCLQAGANVYLSKPINLKELLNVIQAQLHQAGV